MTVSLKRFTRIPKKMLWAFILEGAETKQMIQTFALKGKHRLHLTDPEKGPTEEEMRQAVKQLKDIPRFLPFFVFIVAPMPGVTEGYVLLAITLEKWLGQKVNLLPSHFRDVFKKDDDAPDPSKNNPNPPFEQ